MAHGVRFTATEPCVRCGEETALGSVFFSDRRTFERKKKGPAYLCSLCDAAILAARRSRRRTEDEVRRLEEMGSMPEISWVRFQDLQRG